MKPVAQVSPARGAAYHILLRVDSGKSFAIELLQRDAVAKLSDVDRHLATELVMGVLRWRGDLDGEIELLSGKVLSRFDTEVMTILRLGIYQIRHLTRIPKWAAVNESVELAKLARKRSAAGLVNAVLRKCEPLDESGQSGARVAAACRSVPRWLLDRWSAHFGSERAKELARASVATPATTLRIAGEFSRDEVQAALEAEGIRSLPAEYTERALTVKSGDVTGSAAYRRGLIRIQDEASQLVGELVRPAAGDRVLDLCAAPGGKTAQLAERLGSGGVLAAGDLSARRLATMARLLSGKSAAPCRSPNLVRLDARRPLPFTAAFERILVDAPCSGTGTLARNPEVKWRLQPDDLARLAETQAAILTNALGALAPGGRLVYATCSLEREENEGVVESVLAQMRGWRQMNREELVREFPRLDLLFDSRGYFRTWPDRDGMDGFFAAAIVSNLGVSA